MNIFNHYNGRLVIDDNSLNPAAQNTMVKNALYAAIYSEFLGANKNEKYKKLNTLQRFNKLNEFATQWLKDRGF